MEFSSNFLRYTAAALLLLGITSAFAPYVACFLLLALAVACLVTSIYSATPENADHIDDEINAQYDMPDELRDMPEFAPIGGYRRLTKEPQIKPRLTLVQEISLDRFELSKSSKP